LKINDITFQLKATDRKVEEKDMVIVTLKIITPSYENFVEP
jgi:hypothetical protein